MAMLVVGCLASVVVLALCGRAVNRYLSTDPESDRARKVLARRGIAWRVNALSPCHSGLIVFFVVKPGYTYCERCGDPIGNHYSSDFWERFRNEVKLGNDQSAEDAAYEARDAIRVLREEIAERQGPYLPHHASARR